MIKLKIALLAIASLLAVVVIAQNTAPVEVRLLFATVSMPSAALLAVTLLIGIAMGAISAGWMMRKRRPRSSETSEVKKSQA